MTLFALSTIPHRLRFAAIAALLLALCPFALAQEQERAIRVARISLIEGEVNYQRASDSKKDWFDATLNLPLDVSDQLYSGPNGRAEIQLSGRNLVRINRDTNLRFTQFSVGAIQMALPIGTASFRIHTLDRRQFSMVDARDGAVNDPVYFEVDTPTVAVTFVKEGDYRINVREDGSTEVIVRQGQAEVYNQEIGTVVVKKGRRAIIEGSDYYQIARLEDKDNWDRWTDRRDDDLFSRVNTSFSSRHVPAGIPGVYDLDNYGDWVESPDYGWMWSPRGMPGGWAPYRSGYWRHYPSYGWTWVSYEPWGWVPYHYGRWAYWGSRWCWTPYNNLGLGLGLGLDWGWRPHLVTFFGWGRYNRGYRDGYYDGYRDAQWDYLGWCPLGPRDRYRGGTTIINNNTRIINVQSLSNYNAPGGVSRMERGRFDNGRAVVTEDSLRAPVPTRPGAKNAEALPVVVRHEDLKPTQAMPSRNPLAERAEIARRIEAPIVARRPIERSLDGAARPARDGQTLPPAPQRGGAPAGRETVETGTTPSRSPVERAERPSRAPEYRPAERTAPPVFRGEPARPAENTDYSTPSRPERPSRDSQPSRPSRDDSPRQYEPPSRPQPERHESPAERPERYDPPRRPDPPRESPPPRESSPARQEERPAPPPRESAPPRESSPARSPEPQRAPERPSPPPPSRDSGPSRPERPERPTGAMPSRP